MAEWSEIAKDEDVAYYFDKDAVMPVHVSRYAWTLVDFPKGEKTPSGENYKSAGACTAKPTWWSACR
jgi:hypothetical protein